MNTIDACIMQQAVQYKQCTAEEQRLLAQRAQCGDQDAREQLVLCNLRLVIACIKHFSHAMTNLEDLYQAGVVGLLKAIDHYDLTRDARFSTCAVWWIRQSMQLWIYGQNTVHVSKDTHDLAIKLKHIIVEREASIHEMCVQTKTAPRDVTFTLHYLNTAYMSLDQSLYDGQELHEIIADDHDDFALIEAREEQQAVMCKITRLLAVLTPRERKVVTMYFGLTGQDAMNLITIAQHLGLKRRTVNYIYLCAIRKMQRAAGIQEALAS